jgi:RNA polymerase sigma-70 factor (family 1)
LLIESLVQEKELFARIANGEEAAFRTCFEQWHNNLYAASLHYLKLHEAAEDVVQQVYIRLWEKRAMLKTIDNRDYLFIMCRNECLNVLRRLASHPGFTELMGELFEPTAAGPDGQLITKELREQLEEVIASLPDQQRQVWRLVREEGLSYKAAAAEMDLTPITVKAYLARATKKIASQLKGKHPDLYAFFLIWLIR